MDNAIVSKLAIGVLCLAGAAFSSRVKTNALSRQQFNWVLASLWFATRMGLFAAAFLLLRMEVPSDVAEFYYPQGQEVLRGHVVYQDFASSYAPGFPYLLALILRIWNSPVAIVLASIFIEGAGLLVWLKVIRRIWPEDVARRIGLFSVFGALALVNVAVAGQNQTWTALLLGVAVLAYQHGRTRLAALVAGMPVLFIKFLPVMYVAAFLRRGGKPLQFCVAALSVPIVVMLAMSARGMDVLWQFKNQGSRITSGNIPYLLSAIGPLDSTVAAFALQAISIGLLATMCWFLFHRGERLSAEQILLGLVILTFACGLVNRKFYSNYIVMIFVPFCAVAAMQASTFTASVRFGIFNCVAAIEPSVWFRTAGADEHHFSQLCFLIPRMLREGHAVGLIFFVALEVALLWFYAGYLGTAWRVYKTAAESRQSAPARMDQFELNGVALI